MKTLGIRHIAKLAGVSIGTVDRVLHNRGRVSEESLKKVQAVIQEIDYKPNLLARSLVSKKKVKIALIVPAYHQDEYWQQSQQGADTAVKNWSTFGIELTTCPFSLDDTESFARATKKALALKPTGVIFVPIFYDKGLSFLKKCEDMGLPVVMFNTYLPASMPLSYIGTDSVQSGWLAAELMEMITPKDGKLVIIHFDEDLKNSAHMLEKEKGFRAYYLKENSARAQHIETITLNNTSHKYQKQLSSLFKDRLIAGVFVSTSKTYVIGGFLATHKIGSVKVIGYDLISKNVEFLNQGHIQFLINQNPRKQTEIAINALCNFLLFQIKPDAANLFPLEIITRSNAKSYLTSA